MDHLDEETALDFVSNRLSAEAGVRANAHLDGCESCRHFVAELMRAERPLEHASEELQAGARVAQYVVRRLIGSGGMSLVYAATDTELGREVALKVLRPEVAEVGSTRQRLLREAQSMARLSHPNVLTVYEAKEADGRVYMVMELVEGESLAEWLVERRPPAEVIRRFSEAGKGLAAAHAAGIVHRDFKPANVLVGRDGRVRVMDFGVARLNAPNDVPLENNARTQTGLFLGTPAYTSPEQLTGAAVDARSDQFCFCVSLYEGLYGERPFPGNSLTEVASAVLRGEWAPPPRGSAVPNPVRLVLRRGLSKDPAQRFPTMNDLLSALNAPAPIWPRFAALGAGVAVFAGSFLAWTFLYSPVPPAAAPIAAPRPVPAPDPLPMPAPPPTATPVVHEPARPRPHPATPARGWLKVEPNGLGYADIFIDDAPRGRIPSAEPFALDSGLHRIRAERNGQVLDEIKVVVPSNGTRTVQVNVERR